MLLLALLLVFWLLLLKSCRALSSRNIDPGRGFESLARSHAEPQLTLVPFESEGDPSSCVLGRVVIKSGPFNFRESGSLANGTKTEKSTASKGNSKGSKKSRSEERMLKIEYHLLGGEGLGEVLYCEAWGDIAVQVAAKMKLGGVYRIAAAKYIAKSLQYSTSRREYYLRLDGPLGAMTQIEECTNGPHDKLPSHHSFVNIGKLDKISTSMQVCVIGIVKLQSGAFQRDTKFGSGCVCNAVMQQDLHIIRCSFWRDAAVVLASKDVGSAIALMQVNILKMTGDSWEDRANEATQILPCPDSLRDSLASTTDTDASGTSLTQASVMNYDTAKAQVYTLIALSSCIVAQGARELHVLYEVRGVTVLGLTSVLEDDALFMNACAECKQKVGDADCPQHPGKEKQQRWTFDL